MTSAARRRVWIWAPAALLFTAVIAWLMRPQAVTADFATVDRGPLQVTITDEGEARARDVFVVSAPIAGLMRRVELKAGDVVTANQTVVARVEPTVPIFLDDRALAEGQAAVDAAAAARTYAQAQLRRAEAERDFAQSEFERLRALASRQSISKNDLDSAERRAKAAVAAVAEAEAMIEMRTSEHRQARARLLRPTAKQATQDCDCVLVSSPISGTVLRVINESEATVAAGTPILELGDPKDLEIVVELLSEEAVSVCAGQRVLIEGWGGKHALNGVVRRVEPFGYTKVSALGIEEQRVKVLIDLEDEYEAWRALGHGYRVEPSIIVWEAPDVLRVPTSATFREGDRWAVFVDDDGTARLRFVDLGHQTDAAAEVLRGLEEGERIIMHPNDRIREGTRVAARRVGD